MTLGLFALTRPVRAEGRNLTQAAFASAVRVGSGFALLILDEAGRVLREIPLEARGHDTTVHLGSGIGVMFARRPGDFAVAFEFSRPTRQRCSERRLTGTFTVTGFFQTTAGCFTPLKTISITPVA